MPEVRGDWDQAVTRHHQDDLELAHRLAPGFERLDIPSRKTGRPIEGGLNTLPACDSTYVRDPFLGLRLGCGSGLRRKLEHCCFLTFEQVS